MLTTAPAISRRRRISFNITAGVLLVMLLALLLPILMFIVLAWLPVETWQSVFPDEELTAASAAHRIHELSMSLMFWGLVISVGLQLRRPERRQALLLVVAATAVVFLVIDSISGTLTADVIPILAAVAVLVALHPERRQLFRFKRPDKGMAGLAILAAIPGVFFILDHIDLQRLDIPGDEHAEFAHWSTMAVFATLMVIWTLIGSTDRTGWRVTAWITGITAATFGIGSLVFPDAASSPSTGWAAAAVAWGLALVALAERRARSTAETNEREPAHVATLG